MKPATEKDIHNASALAEVVGDLLCRVPGDLREQVLHLALERERQRGVDRTAHPFSRPFDPEKVMQSPGMRHRGAIMRLKAVLVQVFVRDITNNNSSSDAAELLFASQRYGAGSGRLLEYIGDLITEYAKEQ